MMRKKIYFSLQGTDSRAEDILIMQDAADPTYHSSCETR